MNYTIEIYCYDTGEIETIVRSKAKISEEDLAKNINILMDELGITEMDKVESLLELVYATAKQKHEGRKQNEAEFVKHGKWIDTPNYYQRWRCSLCGCHTRDAAPNYCPNCGAKMDGERKENG